MAHSLEWTTGSSVLSEKGGKSPISYELVVHFPEWTTGSSVLSEKGGEVPISCELVVHFPEWTTGSVDLAGKPVKSLDFVRASGPRLAPQPINSAHTKRVPPSGAPFLSSLFSLVDGHEFSD